MAEYDIAFGERLAETARMVADEGLAELDAQRTVLYLSLLSTEITLKAMLERAGAGTRRCVLVGKRIGPGHTPARTCPLR